MPKRTAVIDIGSNSARLVIYEKTSRYGFYLICEQKSKVRISEGAYLHGGMIQPQALKRAFLTLRAFKQTIEKYKVKQTVCVATSALRDAPNKKQIITWFQKHLKLDIRIIDGDTEAFYGGIATANLLPVSEAITIDIGGGSTDMALIRGGYVVETISLNLGTVRLKELFFDRFDTPNEARKQALAYIQKELSRIPSTFQSKLAVGVGGSARALGKAIMDRNGYPLKKLHAFCYRYEDTVRFFDTIVTSKISQLKPLGIKKSRFDTIREGTLIFMQVLNHVGAKQIMTSAVGVREGVFLSRFLKNDKYRFPASLNPSIVSILDRFRSRLSIETKKDAKIQIAKRLYQVLPFYEDRNKEDFIVIRYAILLSQIGTLLTIYNAHEHAFYIAMHELNYRLTHSQIITIALLLKMDGKTLVDKSLYKQYKSLLPSKKRLKWMSFVYTLSNTLYQASYDASVDFRYRDDMLIVTSDKSLYLAKEFIDAMQKPQKDLHIRIKDNANIPPIGKS